MTNPLARILLMCTRDVYVNRIYYELDPEKYIKTVQRDLNYIYRTYRT